jgi:hypothetical protein
MIDTEKITQAIISTGAGPLAMEEGAALVEHWINASVCVDKTVRGVECGFILPLDDDTYVIGVQDLLTDELEGVVGNEWKTTKEATRYWNEARWYESIAAGSQVRIYALALRSATYYERDRGSFAPRCVVPRIRVKAISKSSPPAIWSGENGGVLTFSDETLENTQLALLAKAAAIRAMRAAQAVPWQLPGIWCTNQFRRTCEHYGDCVAGKHPAGYGVFAPNDPAFDLALPYLGDRLHDPRVVVLGASAYASVSECPEKYRRGTLSGDAEESHALGTGTVFHAGCAEIYRQLREEQIGTKQ